MGYGVRGAGYEVRGTGTRCGVRGKAENRQRILALKFTISN